jgi:hypothetical protein
LKTSHSASASDAKTQLGSSSIENPTPARLSDHQDVASALGEIARPTHPMEKLLQFVAVGAARLTAKFLDEVEPARIDWPMGGRRVIDQHRPFPSNARSRRPFWLPTNI